jgi:hypothetical protein
MKSALDVPQHEPVTKTFEDAKAMVLEERRVIVEKMAWKFNIVRGSLYSGVYNSRRFHKMCATWVPRQLTEEPKYSVMEICFCHLECYHSKLENLLNCIITGD